MTDREIFLNIPEEASPEVLEAYLARACGDDAELRARVESLLAADQAAHTSFMREAPLEGRDGLLMPGGTPPPGEDATIPDPASGERFAPGVVLADRYRIVSILGTGGMGEVYRADDLKLKLPVALKFLPRELSDHSRLLEALFNEVRQARRVSHRHVCRVHDVGEAEGQHFLTMELIKGDDLGALLRRIGRLPRSKAFELGKQLCAGLAAAHREGLLHLDLKPGNLMINDEGELRITDFGLARLADEAARERRRAGTPAYMAPEQMRSGDVSERSDIYAAGLILYEMFTGCRFHSGRSNEQLMAWHLSGNQPESLADLEGSLEPGIGELVLACLRSDPADRPPEVVTLANRLDELQAAVGAGGGEDRAGSSSAGKTLAALMSTKIVGAVELQQRLGTEAFMRYVSRIDKLVHTCLSDAAEARVLTQTGDGFLVRFSDPADAVTTALRIQDSLHRERAEGEPLSLRIGLHLGVVAEMEETARGEKRAIGLPINLVALVMELADGGQILMTRSVYEDARNFAREYPGYGGREDAPRLKWMSHGFYELQGAPEPVELFEVGGEGIAPLRPPEDSKWAARAEAALRHHSRGGEPGEPDELPVEVLDKSDVFLGYSPIDDQVLQPAGEGWVSNFHRNLEIRLQQLTGEPLQIWRGRWTPEQDQPDEQVVERLPSVRAMVSVISPPFVKSNRCRSEVEAFLSDPSSPDEIAPQRTLRIVKAVKRPVPSTEVQPPMREVLGDRGGIEFFDRDAESGRVREFDEAFGERARQRYQERIYDLAHEVCSVLQDVPDAAAGTRKRVYLAMPTYELQDAYDAVRRVLLEKGHTVLPDRLLPMEAAALEHDVRAYLQECDLALHLFGNSYGSIPENAHQSLAELQNRIADEESRAQGFQRLLWIPRDLDAKDERQRVFLKQLQEEGLEDERVDLIRGTVSLFKEVLVRRLNPEEEEKEEDARAAEEEARPRRVYVICDRQDEAAVEPLEDYLFEKGLEVSLPDFEADQDEFRQNHRDNLVDCDAVLIYFGAGRKAWVDTKLRDVLKAIGYGRKEPIRHQVVFIAPPEDRRKERFRTHSGSVIRQGGAAFAPDDELDAFVEAVLRNGGGDDA